MGDIEPIPEGFLARLLQEFGIQWTHLVVISGVVFSSFGLHKYLDPGVWILGTIGSFSLVYLFRYRITGNFPKTVLWAGIILLFGLSAAWAALFVAGQDPAQFLESRTKVSTLYIAIVIGIPIGAMILSYRAQDEFLRSPLPSVLATAAKAISQSDFVHESVDYLINLTLQTNGEVTLRFDVTMDVLNRSKRAALYQDHFDPAGRNKRFIGAKIKGARINESDPNRLTQRGFFLEYHAQPSERFRIVVIGESTFYGRDNELVGVYFPCSFLSIRVVKPPDELIVHVESLLREKVDAERLATGDLLFQYSQGVLPFQGTRVFWAPHT
jgi:hypothetical protein